MLTHACRNGLTRAGRAAGAVACLLAATGVSLAAEQLPDSPAGRLRDIGKYLAEPSAPTVSPLPDGSVLIYGDDKRDFNRTANNQRATNLRNRHERPPAGSTIPDPKLWDPLRRGWRILPPAPECSRASFLHTATVLPNAQVLIAGGLCDHNLPRNDAPPRTAHYKLSLWDAASRSWLTAPELKQPRIDHSASLLPDGSVMLVGGRTDPALHGLAIEQVLASVESYADGQVVEVPPLATARAGHTATVLPGGNVLVVGGFDASGQAIASTELWVGETRTWRTLPPLGHPRHGHSATLLDDGSVLVAGGTGADGRATAAVEVWDPSFQRWQAAPALLQPLRGHAAVLLASGNVLLAGGTEKAQAESMTWAWLWEKAERRWRPAGSARPADEKYTAHPVTLQALPDGNARVFAWNQIMLWQPIEAATSATMGAPLWAPYTHPPTALALRDGRLLLIGYREDVRGFRAILWDPSADRWTDVGSPLPASWKLRQVIELPSGEVLLVGVDYQNTLHCQSWLPADDRWRECGGAKLGFLAEETIALALLPDGRAVAMPTTDDVLVYDPTQRQWSAVTVEWGNEGLTYGSPVRAKQALARFRDPASGAWIEINDLAARKWQAMFGRQAYNVTIGGKLARSVRERAIPPGLLWDAPHQRWAYVLPPGKMGPDAQRLPDGCVISSRPLALFDPRSGRVTALPDPGIAISSDFGSMAVLRDGTVTFAGIAVGATDAGAGFFHRRATCAGFASAPTDADYMPGVLAVDPPPAAATAPSASAPAPPERSRWRRTLDIVLDPDYDRRWLLVALLLPLAAWLITRMLAGTRRQADARPSRAWRVLVYGALLALVVPAVLSYRDFRRERDREACNEDARACLDPNTGLLSATVDGSPAAGQPSIPCRFVGVWSSRQGALMHRIELKDDGSYVMSANVGGVGSPTGYTGRWMVEGNMMVWRHDQAPGAHDANPIEPHGSRAFTLMENNGARTEYELLRAVDSTRCTP